MEAMMKHVAFIALIAACVALEISGVGAGALWILVVFWSLLQYI
jgi:hypothetical protein|tara:strand:+ start:570 stop:701 length:132 start_codon:yes stop_codon:yes gene_type:complete